MTEIASTPLPLESNVATASTPHVEPLSELTAADAASQPKPYLTIRPTSGWAAVNLRELWQFRDLLFSLAGRDLKLRYKQTALGAAWVILQPLMAAGVFSFVFGVMAKLPSNGVPYFLFSYAGLLGWNLFSNTLGKTSGCLVGNAHLISKVFFPRLVLPLSAIPSVLVDFAVALGMMAVLMLIYGVAPTPALLLLPLWMAVLLLLAMGVGLITAALTVSYRDVGYILPVFTQLLLYASPVAYGLTYALERVPPRFRPFYLLNPLAAPLEAFRHALLGARVPAPSLLSICYSILLASIVFAVGAFSFKRMERKFADVI